ncbi:hypothetical protein DPQ25_04735 [Hydrogeniiclostridium mannosilyticum]|uniref:Uncharacterized protein n=1 Tax=Hydrogeniiclostridium mannosilyticum TaxID=2764322 RepID=A0A328UGV5_9FIRM|nr:hypothetical protein DPQ25_04735 [Hydrogeniiclostridium mannosilyticum]
MSDSSGPEKYPAAYRSRGPKQPCGRAEWPKFLLEVRPNGTTRAARGGFFGFILRKNKKGLFSCYKIDYNKWKGNVTGKRTGLWIPAEINAEK